MDFTIWNDNIKYFMMKDPISKKSIVFSSFKLQGTSQIFVICN